MRMNTAIHTSLEVNPYQHQHSNWTINRSPATIDCDTGTLVTFDPGERHSLHGIQDARLLLLLAPWPGHGHNTTSEPPHHQHLPKNATATPLTTPPTDHAGKSAETGG